MLLYEHQDFDQAVAFAAARFDLRESLIEKDYYVTEALRILQQKGGNRIIFKGGTSLSKGWNLIQRFSEDIDIFFDTSGFTPELGKRRIDTELKALRDAVAEHSGLSLIQSESFSATGSKRKDNFEYKQNFSGPGEIPNRVQVETVVASGREPKVTVEIQSYVGKYLDEMGKSLGADDEGPFQMQLLHFRRTFVEKLFAIHSKVEIRKRDGIKIRSYARHYYDLFCLAKEPEVLTMLNAEEYARIKTDYDSISSEHFGRDHIPPQGLTFANSDALFPPDDLDKEFSSEYTEQCKSLCFGATFPSWQEVRECFDSIRDRL